MPKLTIDGKTIVVHWLKEWDKQILYIAKTFKNKAGFVAWRTALEDGHMRGLPALKLQDYSHRYSELKARRKPGYKEKRRKYNQGHPQTHSKHGTIIRDRLYRSGSLNPLRKKLQCPPRDLWSKEQHDILKALTINNRRGMYQIDWPGVMEEKAWLRYLPKKYRSNLALLRKYYQILKRLEDPKTLKKRRKDSLRWRNENKARYLKNLLRRKKKITQVTREYFLEKIPRY